MIIGCSWLFSFETERTISTLRASFASEGYRPVRLPAYRSIAPLWQYVRSSSSIESVGSWPSGSRPSCFRALCSSRPMRSSSKSTPPIVKASLTGSALALMLKYVNVGLPFAAIPACEPTPDGQGRIEVYNTGELTLPIMFYLMRYSRRGQQREEK